MFEKAEWIKNVRAPEIDGYTEFLLKVPDGTGEDIKLYVSCDGVFATFIGDEIMPAAFSACADLPSYKLYDCFDLSGKVKSGDIIRLQVWHEGVDSANYIAAPQGIIFELRSGGKTIAYSDEDTPCRNMTEYKNGYRKQITTQLGFSYFYDAAKVCAENVYERAVLSDGPSDFFPRKIKNQSIGQLIKGKIIKTDGSVLLDLGKETTGFLYLDLTCGKSGLITIAYGEHILDGKVRRKIDDRDFSVEYYAVGGENKYINCFRRQGCRYLELFADEGVIGEINEVGILPTGYAVERKDADYGDEIINRINSVCINTLELCMHEHYEDCPWREQGFYAFDGRNQALCGYYAFKDGNAVYARENLVLIANSIDRYGLLRLCATGGIDYPIPFFSLAFFLAAEEYVGHTGDKTLLYEVKPTLDSLYKIFRSKIDKSGLIERFPSPFWNFYEWSDGSDNYDSDIGKYKDKPKEKEYHCVLNCAYVLADKAYRKLFGLPFDGIENTVKAIGKTFEKSDGTFRLSDKTDKSSCLASALAILVGAASDEKKTARAIADCCENGGKLVAATLSTKGFIYDALLKVDNKYGDFVIKDIVKTYKPMLDAGATSFWETEIGANDFGGGGSLCHGWSAMPIYYFAGILGRK